ncbi:MAG: hypothetical protein HAW59_06170 [Betaproteobacteria bacterium]|nr:hypothetical protein [Betaproteobacteria bacterium]
MRLFYPILRGDFACGRFLRFAVLENKNYAKLGRRFRPFCAGVFLC